MSIKARIAPGISIIDAVGALSDWMSFRWRLSQCSYFVSQEALRARVDNPDTLRSFPFDLSFEWHAYQRRVAVVKDHQSRSDAQKGGL